MQPIFPKRLKKGSRLRIVAPSRSAAILDKDLVEFASKALSEQGFVVSFGKHIYEQDEFLSASVEARIEDLHDAFADATVDGILTAIGGYNANQLLTKLDYELIRKNPKVLCGFSDITVLSNAIFAKTGLVTYSGPHFSTWGMQQGFEYARAAFLSCVTNEESLSLQPSDTWSDDPWFLDQSNRNFMPNKGYVVVNEGLAQGRIVGGHLRCLGALQGTEFWPSLKDTILFIEEDEETTARLFDRLLETLTQQTDFSGVRGIVIGRFQTASQTPPEIITKIIQQKPQLARIPIICNVDIGHTSPIITFPIGGEARIKATKHATTIEILKH